MNSSRCRAVSCSLYGGGGAEKSICSCRTKSKGLLSVGVLNLKNWSSVREIADSNFDRALFRFGVCTNGLTRTCVVAPLVLVLV